jgi:hypothetical protein
MDAIFFLASRNTASNIAAVSFPVAVFWFEGWYDASSIMPFGNEYRAAWAKVYPALLRKMSFRFR